MKRFIPLLDDAPADGNGPANTQPTETPAAPPAAKLVEDGQFNEREIALQRERDENAAEAERQRGLVRQRETEVSERERTIQEKDAEIERLKKASAPRKKTWRDEFEEI